jgi:hypothetical protein
MNSSAPTENKQLKPSIDGDILADSNVVLARDAGVPYQPPRASADPFGEWVSLMEVVQVLCPKWPLRERPTLGSAWKI